ncbi:MAG: RNA-processing protein [Methanocorpusculum sp.]|jgi:nucleolar protein 56|nr:RNA-processing protein [Methanocorpusculum sp.]
MHWYGEPGNLSIEPAVCGERIQNTTTIPSVLCNWQDLKDAGLINSRDEYIRAVRAVTFSLAEKGIAFDLDKKDAALLQMVKTLDEMDNVINLLTERVIDWHAATTPGTSHKYTRSNGPRIVQKIANSGSPSLKRVAREILSLSGVRTDLMKEVSREAVSVIPNMSALVGGLVAARLIARAGGLEETAKMPGSSIQVIGAESALFSHIRTGSSSPKHGIIFQHRRVHNADKAVRGKVARQLAAKLAIASRLDLYRGELDVEFVDAANAKIDKIFGGES